MAPFEDVPPVVLTTVRPGGLEIYLLPSGLANVPDPEISGQSIERIPPRVAEPVRPDRRSRVGPPDERVVRRDAERSFARELRVDPEHLAEQRGERLPVAERIAPAPSVTETDVQE